jgi:pseudomonalisin/xanthomonalisin
MFVDLRTGSTSITQGVNAMDRLSHPRRGVRRTQRVVQLSIAALALAHVMVALAQSAWTQTETRAHPTTNATLRAKLDDTEVVDVVVGLRLRNADKLDQVMASQTTPGDLQFGHWLTPEEILADYAPTESQAQAVVSHLARSGFTSVQVADNRLLVTASGTAASVRKAFNTELAHFFRDGKDGIANLNDVSVPSELGGTVLSVIGLQTLDRPHVIALTAHDPVAFPTIYDAASLPSAANTAVAIITEGSMAQPIVDLHTFETENSLPTINPTVVNVGGTSNDTSNQVEWDLDSQTIQAMAGGTVKQMLLYTATALTDAALTQTFNTAVSDNIATVINVSIGGCEQGPFNDGSMSQDDAIFKLAVAQGQTFSVASGDDGSNQCSGGGVAYPASSPYVIAVGGTSLSTNGNTYVTETAWGGSGGGPSAYEPQPTWQNSIVPGTKRGVPDLAFDADPASGATIVVSGNLETWGGTSLASPLFVGSWARLQSLHSNTLGFPAEWIYMYGNNRPASAFHDVTSGSNGAYSAGIGWDYVTGWGSFDVAAVATAIYTIDSPVMTEFTNGNGVNGFSLSLGEGSMSPGTTSNGYTYQQFRDTAVVSTGVYKQTLFQVSGFTSDPGQAWLISAAADGTTRLGASAAYSYLSGTATWQWTTGPMFNGFGTTTCTIAHH